MAFTVGEVIRLRGRNLPDKVGFIDEVRNLAITFREFDLRTNRLANALLGIGLKRGDRVAWLGENSYFCLEILGAAAKAGLVFLPLNNRHKEKELTEIFQRVKPAALLLTADYLETIFKLDQKETRIILIDEGQAGGQILNYYALFSRASSLEPAVQRPAKADDLLVLIQTSGTTGGIKEVAWSHQTYLNGVLEIILTLGIKQSEVLLHNIAYFHVPFLWSSLAQIFLGGTNVFTGKFDPEKVVRTLVEQKITWFGSVPTMLLSLLDVTLTPGFNQHIKRIFYGGAPMPLPILERAMERFGPILFQLYGLTETSGVFTCLSSEDHQEAIKNCPLRLRSCGLPTLNTSIKIVDETDMEVQEGQVGQLLARGWHLMDGYWENAEKTRESLKEGWLYTGDLARRDAEGYIYIVDRKKDVIISGGENIYSREVEDVVRMHPGIEDAAVVGVSDEYWGESVKAFVVKRPGANISEEEVVDFCKRHLAGYKAPRVVEFIGQLPRNAGGKIVKNLLKCQI